VVSIKPFAFVLMPFDDRFSDIYKLGIQAAATECGVVAERVDEQKFSEPILERIYRQIGNADFIIADMTGRNPNVFYEVGYAHALGKLCTLLTQEVDDIPFDLKHHRHIVYGGSIQTLKQHLTAELNWLKTELERRNTSAFTIELTSAAGELEKDAWRADAKIELRFDIHNRTQRRSPEIEAIYLYTTDKWRFTLDGVDCPHSPVEGKKNSRRHFIKSPVPRLSPGAWAQVRVNGVKTVWYKWEKQELREKYTLSGALKLELSTSEGNFQLETNPTIEVEEFPF
jgi:hypothetical protein